MQSFRVGRGNQSRGHRSVLLHTSDSQMALRAHARPHETCGRFADCCRPKTGLREMLNRRELCRSAPPGSGNKQQESSRQKKTRYQKSKVEGWLHRQPRLSLGDSWRSSKSRRDCVPANQEIQEFRAGRRTVLTQELDASYPVLLCLFFWQKLLAIGLILAYVRDRTRFLSVRSLHLRRLPAATACCATVAFGWRPRPAH